MNYKKYDMGSYNLHCVQTDKFKTTSISIKFKRKVKKEEITIRNFLSAILLESSKKFPTKRLMNIETEELYDLTFRSSCSISGNYSLLDFESSFLNDKYTEEGLLEKAISFIIGIIDNPNVIDNRFDEESFNLVKESLQQELDSIKENPSRYAYQKLLENMDSKSPLSFNVIGYKEDLEKITPDNLYEYYKSFIKNDIVDVFIISPVNANELKSIFASKITNNILKKAPEKHILEHNKYRKTNKIIHEKGDFEQSKLYIGCKLDKLNDFELQYVSRIYSFILGGSPDSKLFQTIREKNSLCYSINSQYKPIFNLLVISAGINAKDFKKVLRLTKKEMKNIASGNFYDDAIESAKLTYINSFKEIEDSPFGILGTYISHVYMNFDLIDDRIKNIKRVTKHDLIEFSKKIHIDTVYVLEGVQVDE